MFTVLTCPRPIIGGEVAQPPVRNTLLCHGLSLLRHRCMIMSSSYKYMGAVVGISASDSYFETTMYEGIIVLTHAYTTSMQLYVVRA